MSRDPRIDAYIAKSRPFARPILESLRETIHEACPGCEEAIKWGAPAFLYKGRALAGMAAFKAHAALTFRRRDLDLAAHGLEDKTGQAMGQLGRIESLEALPPGAAIAALVRQSMALDDAGIDKPSAPKQPVTMPPVPKALTAALDANPTARAHFDAFPPSGRRDYVEWIAEAKREETRAKRVATAIEWIAEGKKRHWKYQS